ncbi:hypothetical protein ACRAWD_16930 [Caulobacter segnis]
MTDTIFALATAAGRAAVAVVRVSGPATLSVVAALTERRRSRVWPSCANFAMATSTWTSRWCCASGAGQLYRRG